MIKILLADDHSVIRSALKKIIEDNIPGSVVEETVNADMVVEKIQTKNYNLLVLDINMPGINSVDLLAKIFSMDKAARVLIFSMNPVVPFEKMYLKLGAKGYLPKTSSQEEIFKAIHTILDGNIYHTLEPDTTTISNINPFKNLSQREFEILMHVLRGETVKEIFRQTGLAVSTISTYKARIHEKLGTHNNMELVSLAKKYDIIKE